MIKNYFFVAAGLFSIFFAAGHVYWGQEFILAPLQAQGTDGILLALVRMGWNLPAWTTLLSGIALVIVSLRSSTADGVFLAWFVIVLNLGRYVMLLATVSSLPTYDLGMLAAQSVGVFFYVGVVWLGIRRKQGPTLVLE